MPGRSPVSVLAVLVSLAVPAGVVCGNGLVPAVRQWHKVMHKLTVPDMRGIILFCDKGVCRELLGLGETGRSTLLLLSSVKSIALFSMGKVFKMKTPVVMSS